MRRLFLRFAGLWRRSRDERDMAEEFESHLALHIEDNVRAGMTLPEARRQARMKFGSLDAAKEDLRELRTFQWVDDFVRDLRLGLRQHGRNRVFTAAALGVIASGIAATTAAFTLFDRVLLASLPYPAAQNLVTLCQTQRVPGGFCIPASWQNFLDWQRRSTALVSMGAYTGVLVTISGHGEPRRIAGFHVTSGFFQTLGVPPIVGRAFTAIDDGARVSNVAILSEALAEELFGAPANAIGQTIRLDDNPHSVIGVMPASFSYPTREARVWTNLGLRFTDADRADLMFRGIGRLRTGVSFARARTEIMSIGRQLEAEYPKENHGMGANAFRLRDMIAPQSRSLVWAVLATAGCLALIACVNLANLLIARALARGREISVRIAIGGSRGRLVRQMLTENLLLAVLGGALGIGVAWVATPYLGLLVPAGLPMRSDLQVDSRALAFAALISAATALAAGLWPALRATGVNVERLRSRGESDAQSARLRSVLITAEIAGTVTLLVVAGLLLKALWRVENVDLGFRTDHILTMRTMLPQPKYERVRAREDFYANVLREVGRLPGVVSAAYAGYIPMAFTGGIFDAALPEQINDPNARVSTSIRFVTPRYFETFGIRVLRGRSIQDTDDARSPWVTVISEALARRLFANQDPIGRRINVAFADRIVIGVVGETAVFAIEQPSQPQVYFPSSQIFDRALTFHAPKDLAVHTQTDAAALALIPAIRRIVHAADGDVAVDSVRMMSEVIAAQTEQRRLQLSLIGAFSGVAVLLVAVGIYGLVSFAVSQRKQEVGVRYALGARPANIRRMFVRQGAVLGFAGIAAAIPLSYLASRSLAALLFGVDPLDAQIYGAAAFIALTIVLVGSLGPALRASRIDPAAAIRVE